MTDCIHLEFVVEAEVTRLVDLMTRLEKTDGAASAFMAAIKIRCRECGLYFTFEGLPRGVSFYHPLVSSDRTELRAPIKPAPRERLD